MERSPLEELVPVLSSVKVSCEPVAASSSFQTAPRLIGALLLAADAPLELHSF